MSPCCESPSSGRGTRARVRCRGGPWLCAGVSSVALGALGELQVRVSEAGVCVGHRLVRNAGTVARPGYDASRQCLECTRKSGVRLSDMRISW